MPVYNAPVDGSELDLGYKEEPGVANKLHLQKEDILANLRAIQIRNGLKQTDDLKSLDFTVEMETGTGKTYVYLRTIFELHKAYGMRSSSSSCQAWLSVKACINRSKSPVSI